MDRRKTRKEKFLDRMENVVPWADALRAIESKTPASGRGRKPIGDERMLRIYLVQQWYGSSDQETVELLLDTHCVAAFCGFDAHLEKMPDRTTLVKFRQRLVKADFAAKLMQVVDAALNAAGVTISRGTVVDATVVEASQSTKNAARQPDPEAGKTRKRGNWNFGYKLHIGVCAARRRIHHATVTPANVHDSQELGRLLTGEETEVYGDSAYLGQGAVLAAHAPAARDCTHERGVVGRPLTDAQRARNRAKSATRALVEHPFRIIKHQFGHRRTRYRGLRKNAEQLLTLCALANLYQFRDALAA